jgi:hypothetical protein
MGAPGEKKHTIESDRRCESPHELNPRIPRALSNLIMECCESEREHRPRDMREVLSRLDTVRHMLSRKDRAERQEI